VGEDFTEDVAVQDAHGMALPLVYRAGALRAVGLLIRND
jgi:hypothetical protein